MKRKILEITIGEQNDEDVGPSVSICWKNAPRWNDETDQIWTEICNAIHALLVEFKSWPENGWAVEFKKFEKNGI